jgi:zinc transport system ATP-binding protein
MAPVAELRNLSFSINGYPILVDVDFTVEPGEFLAVIGPNGGGKTTLIKLMLGLLEPDRGSVGLFGSPPRKTRHRAGYVPQNIHVNLDFPISVLDVVLMGRKRRKFGLAHPSREDLAAAREALEWLGMWDLRHQRIGELSGGQRQRVYIARALVGRPEALFLDEPTASVDAEGQTALYEHLKALNETVTIVVVSHDVMVLSSYVKSVACVNRRVYYHAAPEVTPGMLQMAYRCPVELLAHGHLPHRVLHHHDK